MKVRHPANVACNIHDDANRRSTSRQLWQPGASSLEITFLSVRVPLGKGALSRETSVVDATEVLKPRRHKDAHHSFHQQRKLQTLHPVYSYRVASAVDASLSHACYMYRYSIYKLSIAVICEAKVKAK